MPFDKSGTLIINASSAGGALPASDVVVRISGAVEENRDVQYSLITDVDGISERITLPAPSAKLSMRPGANEQSYALYDILISAPGYYTKRVYNVAVFDGQETVQPINMIPLDVHLNGVTYPRDNLFTTSRENELLE